MLKTPWPSTQHAPTTQVFAWQVESFAQASKVSAFPHAPTPTCFSYDFPAAAQLAHIYNRNLTWWLAPRIQYTFNMRWPSGSSGTVYCLTSSWASRASFNPSAFEIPCLFLPIFVSFHVNALIHCNVRVGPLLLIREELRGCHRGIHPETKVGFFDGWR